MHIVDMSHQCGIPFLLHLARPMLRKAHQERSQRFLSRQAFDVLQQFIHIGPGVGVNLRVVALRFLNRSSDPIKVQILQKRNTAITAIEVTTLNRFVFAWAEV